MVDIDIVPNGFVLGSVTAFIRIDRVISEVFQIVAEEWHHFYRKGKNRHAIDPAVAEKAQSVTWRDVVVAAESNQEALLRALGA